MFKETIDAFIEKRPQFLRIGKASIIAALLKKENNNLLVSAENQEWYEYFFSKLLLKKPEDFIQDKLSIITFNYDRSFEYYFFHAVKNSYGLNDKETAKLMAKVPIIHVYGKLGDLPHLGENVVEYGKYVNQWPQAPDVVNLLDETVFYLIAVKLRLGIFGLTDFFTIPIEPGNSRQNRSPRILHIF